MTNRIRLLVLVALAVTLSGCLYDKNGDGVIRLRLVGDSLTKSYIYGVPWGTGEKLKTMLPAGWDVVNLAEPGRRLIEGDPPSCWQQAEQAIADGADGVVLACGTNDLGALGGTETANTLLALQAMLKDAGVLVFLSSIPPRGATPDQVAFWQPIVDAADDILLAVPGVIDLTTDYDSLDTTCYFDGVHFTDLCQVRRACRIATYLLDRVPGTCMPEDFALDGADPNPTGTYGLTWRNITGIGAYRLTETVDAGTPTATFVPSGTTRMDFANKPAGTYQYTLAACAKADGGCGGDAGPLTVTVTGP
jgi:hypothetical protein